MMETLTAISIGFNIGFVASFFIRRRHVRKLWDWIRGRRPPKEDLEDVMCCLKPEPTPLMKAPHASFGFPPHGYTNRDWRMRELKERCREE